MSHVTASTAPLFTNKVYDVLKWIALVALPAAGFLYFGLSEIWGLPYAVQIMGTTAAIDTFLGAILGISNRAYKKSDSRFDGSLTLDTRDPEKDVLSFNFEKPIKQVAEEESITLKVDNPPS